MLKAMDPKSTAGQAASALFAPMLQSQVGQSPGLQYRVGLHQVPLGVCFGDLKSLVI